jgi:hypothetical protein
VGIGTTHTGANGRERAKSRETNDRVDLGCIATTRIESSGDEVRKADTPKTPMDRGEMVAGA